MASPALESRDMGIERKLPADDVLEKALERLGAHFSADPELDKPHPLQPYKPTLMNRLDRSLMSGSLYDSSIDWTDAEEELARKIGLYAMAFLLAFGLWLGVESNRGAVKPTEPFSSNSPTYISPRVDIQGNEFKDPLSS